MKSFLRGILTIWITILLFVFGMVLSIKGILIDTTDQMIKKELKDSIIETVKEYGDVSNKAIKEIETSIDQNKTIKKIMNTCYDEVLAVLEDKESKVDIDVTKELNTLIDEGEDILKSYGVVITKEEKEELLSIVSNSEINKYVNETVNDLKSDIPEDVEEAIDVFCFLSSPTFKIIVIGLIILSLVFIALLKKSYYGWLSNFGVSTITIGFIMGVLLPRLVDFILTSELEDFTLSVAPLNNYGYILMVLGVIALIIKFIIDSKLKSKNIKQGKTVEE